VQKTATKAVVTGSPERVDEVAVALEAAGVEVMRVSDLDRLAAVVSGLQPGSLDCYVQLPVALEATGDTVVARVRGFLDGGLLTRFRLAETVLPALSAEATVVVVAGHTPVSRDSPDDPDARMAFLKVLAQAMSADKVPAKMRVRILRDVRGPAEIARVALTGEPGDGPAADLRDLAGREETMSYQDWRTEVLGLISVEF
jgi:hypothetical protein